ncbi:MAG: helix-turn-helix domain-containing protein [Butyrivibrio sp.]|jgi:AraC-like DNA-binding protein|nr:helix-turn-helix domain-containing protein [Butyrivibrio sp.]
MKPYYEKIDVLKMPYEAFSYTLTPDNGIAAHWHYYMEVIYFRNGCGLIGDGTCETPVRGGQIAVFPPKRVHSIRGKSAFSEYMVLKFDPYLFGSAGLGVADFGTLFECAEADPAAPMILTQTMLQETEPGVYFEKIIEELQARRYGYSLEIRCQTISLLLEIIRIWRNQGFDTDRAFTLSNELRSLSAYIYDHAGDSLEVEQLAEKCHMSYSYFARMFREVYGRSCSGYISYVRVNKVREMLQFTDFDLDYISHDCGFADCSHMIRVFRKSEGITPGKYRKMVSRKADENQ